MKKIILVLVVLFINFAFAREDMPVIPTNGSYNVEYKEDNLNLINVDKMKRKDKINNAKSKAEKNMPQGRFQFDQKQIQQQRIIDYMNNQRNTLLPVF